jgi:hypothetical protein
MNKLNGEKVDIILLLNVLHRLGDGGTAISINNAPVLYFPCS